jgi:hypothetical protein
VLAASLTMPLNRHQAMPFPAKFGITAALLATPA